MCLRHKQTKLRPMPIWNPVSEYQPLCVQNSLLLDWWRTCTCTGLTLRMWGRRSAPRGGRIPLTKALSTHQKELSEVSSFHFQFKSSIITKQNRAENFSQPFSMLKMPTHHPLENLDNNFIRLLKMKILPFCVAGQKMKVLAVSLWGECHPCRVCSSSPDSRPSLIFNQMSQLRRLSNVYVPHIVHRIC